ncbi:MAG: hypothetical protein M0R77_01220 [Gammaproteobacteria bacterium]|nr:hypothetical protein [Acholeplasmataceae bacterium]MCK9529177.1 hypothetical protein [Gammaproteobacteria bacterium]
MNTKQEDIKVIKKETHYLENTKTPFSIFLEGLLEKEEVSETDINDIKLSLKNITLFTIKNKELLTSTYISDFSVDIYSSSFMEKRLRLEEGKLDISNKEEVKAFLKLLVLDYKVLRGVFLKAGCIINI